MKKLILLLVIGLLGCICAKAQQPSFTWAKQLGGNEVGNLIFDRSYTTVVDKAGNVYTAGYFFSNGNADFDPGPGVFNLMGGNYTTVFLSKLDANGNFVWAKRIGSSGDEVITSMVLDKTGHILVTGNFDTQADFNPGSGTEYLYPNGDFDVFIEKLDTAGNFVWAKSIGSTTKESESKIATDSAGNVYITGSFTGTADFDPGTGVYNLASLNFTPSRNYADAYILKLDAAGNFVWAYSFGGFGEDYGTAITVDKDNNVYASGFLPSNSQVDFDPGPGTYMVQAGSEGGSAYLVKLNRGGGLVWVKTFDGYYEYNFAFITTRGLTTDQQDNIYLGGDFINRIDLNPGPDTFMVTSQSQWTDMFITKLDSAGNFLWGHKFGGSKPDILNDLQTDTANNVYATGHFYDMVDFDPGPGIANLTGVGGENILILKLDQSGNYSWAKSIGNTTWADGYALAVDKDNNIITTGNFRGIADLDPGSGIYNMTSNGTDDIFILKLSQQNILPVHLLTFNALLKDNSTLLTWQVEAEQNFDRYQIERSRNGKDFTSIGAVKAANKKEYNYTDNNPSASPLSNSVGEGSGVRLYRLKLIDRDGAFTYSPIRQINIKHSTFNIFPNPAHNIVTITGERLKTITLADNAGRTVLTKVAGNSQSDEIAVGHLPKGLYLLTVTTTGGNTQSEKLVIE